MKMAQVVTIWSLTGEMKKKEKTKKSKVVYADSSELKNLNALKYDELNNAGFQTDVLLSLVEAYFIGKRENK